MLIYIYLDNEHFFQKPVKKCTPFAEGFEFLGGLPQSFIFRVVNKNTKIKS